MAKDLHYLGVDIGAGGIKVAQLKNEGGRAHLVTYGYSEHGTVAEEGIFSNPDIAGKELAGLCRMAGVTTKQAITGLPMASVFSTLFTLPDVSDKDMERQITEKIKKLAPIPPEDIVLDWKKVGEAAEKTVKVSVTAASRKMIERYVQIFKVAGLQLLNLETEAFAVIRALLGKDKAPALIVDIGSVKTNVLVVKEGVPLVHRTVKFGGNNIGALLAEKMKISFKEAEEIKKNFSTYLIEGQEALLKPLISSVVNEAKYCQGLYAEQYNGDRIEKMVLTGGSAPIIGVSEELQKSLGLRIFLGDPWARIIYPDELRPVLDNIGSRFAVAIGLAMMDIG